VLFSSKADFTLAASNQYLNHVLPLPKGFPRSPRDQDDIRLFNAPLDVQVILNADMIWIADKISGLHESEQVYNNEPVHSGESWNYPVEGKVSRKFTDLSAISSSA
jgi:hypothetical protein